MMMMTITMVMLFRLPDDDDNNDGDDVIQVAWGQFTDHDITLTAEIDEVETFLFSTHIKCRFIEHGIREASLRQ